MTAFTIIEYCQANSIYVSKEKIIVSACTASINGTTAELLEGDFLSVWNSPWYDDS